MMARANGRGEGLHEEEYPQRTRPIRCFWGRATREACMEPATVELLAPYPHLTCEEHARAWVEDLPGQPWEWSDPETYARECEAAVSQRHRSLRDTRERARLPGALRTQACSASPQSGGRQASRYRVRTGAAPLL